MSGHRERLLSLQRLGLAAALLLVVPASVGSAEGILLVSRFAPGERVRYRMHLTVETESTLNPLGRALADREPLRLAIDMTWQVEVLAAEPSGTVTLRALIEALTLESSVPSPRDPTGDFVGRAITYRLRSDGGVDNIKAPEEWLEEGQPPAWLQTWLEQGSGTPSALPSYPISPGEKWSDQREFDVPGLPRQRLRSESEYLGDEKVDGQTCASILTRFELSGADVHEPEALAGLSGAIERQVQGGGSRLSCFDHRTGRLLESSQKSRENIRIEIRASPDKSKLSPPSVVLESSTLTESHLHVVN